MITDRIYVDSILLDVPTSGLAVTLNYRGNVLDGLKGIQANFTNTIRLPRTEKNLSAFGVSQVVSNPTTYPYRYHTAQYESDGVLLVRDGRAVLMSITDDSIEMMLIWGAGVAFDVLAGEAKLSDLTGTVTRALTEHASITEWSSLSNTNYPLCFHDSNANNTVDSLPKPYGTLTWSPTLPSIKVDYVLSLIAAQMGATYNFQSNSAVDGSYILPTNISVNESTGSVMYIHLPSPVVDDTTMLVTSDYNVMANTTIYKAVTTAWDYTYYSPQSERTVKLFTTQPTDSTPAVSGITSVVDVVVTIQARIYYTTATQYEDIALRIVDDSGNVVSGLSATPTTSGSYSLMTVTGEANLKAGKKYYFQMHGASSFVIGSDTYISLWLSENTTATIGRYYNLVKSLPDVKVVDFIATLAAISGTFPVAYSDNEMRFYTYASLFTDTPIDWSYKLASYGVEYKVDGWAQSNNLLWADSDKSGAVTIDDETIEASRDWYKSQFNIGEEAFYPYFEMKDQSFIDDVGETFNGRVWSFVKPKPCIHFVKKATDTFAGINLVAVDFDSLDFSTIVANNYPALSAILEHPRIVEVSVRMQAAEIINLDLSKTYYFEQLGAKFVIVSVQYNRGLAKCKMLKIPKEI